jgi:membrane glycosyltransferase
VVEAVPSSSLSEAPSRIDVPWQRRQSWQQAAALRRQHLLLTVLGGTAVATVLMAMGQPLALAPFASVLYLALFALLFAWVLAGCATAVMGFLSIRQGDRHTMRAASVTHRPVSPDARTAIVMPIRHEDLGTVFGGLQAMCESLANARDAGIFDVFVLSDTSDPDIRVAELASLVRLREAVAAVSPELAERIYYRWRQRRTKRKAGNVADFCRRWGRRYHYMIVLDADSVMTREALVGLVQLMEAHPQAGIIQAAPRACGQHSLHARAQQFASHVAGRLFVRGMQYWQLGESHYWGHNAIIRVEPFMRHCALPPLPGRGGLSGDILSHDFVEAALMRRAGFYVWMVSDLTGSYEQVPSNLLEELQRDRRWCQGNLQNARLMAEPGLHPVHRTMLATGVMAYLSAPLWLAFVATGLYLNLSTDVPSTDGWGDVRAVVLWLGMAVMLLLPRVLGGVAAWTSGEARRHGGVAGLCKSALLEAGLSVLYAPVRMMAHTVFVTSALTGWAIEWTSPVRGGADVGWQQALRACAVDTAGAGVVLAGLAWMAPDSLCLMLPLLLPLMLAAPVIVWTSRVSAGQAWRERGWLLTAEELWAPAVLQRAWQLAVQAWQAPRLEEALLDVRLFHMLCALAPRRLTQGARRRHRRAWVLEALSRGLASLDDTRRMYLLNEPTHLVPLLGAWDEPEVSEPEAQRA